MSEPQEFCLRWNDFHSNFHISLDALRGDEFFTDVTLSCSGRLIKAHRVILSACSSHFKEILRGIPSQQHPVIVLPTVEYEVMQAILEFIYQGQVNVRRTQLGAFLQVAETFSIQGLADDDGKKSTGKGTGRQWQPPDSDPPAKRRRADATVVPPASTSGPSKAASEPPTAATDGQPAAPAVVMVQHSEQEIGPPDGSEKSAGDEEADATGQKMSVSIKTEGLADAMVGELLVPSGGSEMLDPDMEPESDVVAQAMATMEHESSVETPSPMLAAAAGAGGRKARRSLVWEYFVVDGDTMVCKLCGKRMRGQDGGGIVPFNSSNFWKHLRRLHDIENS